MRNLIKLALALGIGVGMGGATWAGAAQSGAAQPGAVQSGTNVLIPVSTDTVWTATQGPYLIRGTLVVKKGAVLTVEPGTVVRFQPASSSREVSGLVVRGGLTAIGTDRHPIYFLPDKEGASWGGIYFDHSDPSHSSLEDCVVKGGRVSLNASSPDIQRCSISGSAVAVQVGADSSPIIASNNLTGNAYGLSVQSSTASPLVRYNRISGNDYGVYLRDFGSPTFTDNAIAGNHRYNVVMATAKSVRMAGNNFGSSGPQAGSIYDASRDRKLGRVILAASAPGQQASSGGETWNGPRLSISLNGLVAQRIADARRPFDTALGNSLRVEIRVRPALAYGIALGYNAFTEGGKVAYATTLDGTGKLIPFRTGGFDFYMLGGLGLNLMALQPAWGGHYHALAGLGTEYHMDSTWGMDLGVIYNFYSPIASPLETVSFRFGVTYGFGI